jgi:site-specific recombinase XerC
MRCAGDRTTGLRTRASIVLFWRAGLRISEALVLAESDLDPARGSVVVRRGKGDCREGGMDAWAWEHIHRWMQVRLEMPVGTLLCVIGGPTAGRPWCQPWLEPQYATSR